VAIDKGGKRGGTKQKIVHAATDLFAKKGFTETSVREIATAVGVNESSLYNHFDSKGAILEYILEYYRQTASAYQVPAEALSRLTKDATAEDILACMMMYYPPEEEQLFIKMLQVLFQEQFRNDAVRDYIANDLILWNEQFISDLLHRLIRSGALDTKTDVDFWAKVHVSINYKFSACHVMGIGEIHPGYKGKGNVAMKRTLYEVLFTLHGAKETEDEERNDCTMLENFFTELEIAEELGIPEEAVKDLLANKMELNKSDVDKLLSKMAKKMKIKG